VKARESAEPPKRVVDLEEREARDGRRAFPDHGGSHSFSRGGGVRSTGGGHSFGGGSHGGGHHR
jgi:uncharacterized membrane protein YgcG